MLVASPHVDSAEFLQLLRVHRDIIHVLSAFKYRSPVYEEGPLPPGVVHGRRFHSFHAGLEHIRQPDDQAGLLQDA